MQDPFQVIDRAVEDAIIARLGLHAGQVEILQAFQCVGMAVSLDSRAIIRHTLQERNHPWPVSVNYTHLPLGVPGVLGVSMVGPSSWDRLTMTPS